MLTNEQKMAQKAHSCVSFRKGDKFADYNSFALSFPALIHTCGLAQAVAFAEAKGRSNDYLADLKAVFNEVEKVNLRDASLKADTAEYMRISLRAISAASWIKRYCQAHTADGGAQDGDGKQ